MADFLRTGISYGLKPKTRAPTTISPNLAAATIALIGILILKLPHCQFLDTDAHLATARA